MFFGPNNSIIIPFDYQDPLSFEKFEDQIQAVGEHYRFAKLSEVVKRLQQGKRQGLAAIVFENPRKGVLLHAVPALISLNIPFTIFIDPDYVGLNRLPPEEELKAYHSAYSEKLGLLEVTQWVEKARVYPAETDRFLKECRKIVGPLPLNQMDPLQFFTTWGKLTELSPELVEFGMRLSHQVSSLAEFEEKMRFTALQLKTKLTLFRAHPSGLSQSEQSILLQTGIESILGNEVSEVTKKSTLLNLPVWKLISET